MSKIAIVAMGASAHEYMRTAEMSGNRKSLFDEVWMVNGFGHVFQHDRLFAMDDIRLQYLRGKHGNHKIGRLVEALRHHPGPVYTSRALPEEPPSELMLDELKRIIAVLPEGQEKELRQAEYDTLQAERELMQGGGFKGLHEFPLEEVINKFRAHPYFNSTVPYAIALAAYEGHDMTIYGADYHYPTNVTPEGRALAESGRACCEFWVGIAVASGLNVDVTHTSTLMDAGLGGGPYGYDGKHIMGEVKLADGHIKFDINDIPLPPAAVIERRYYKGAPSQMGTAKTV